MASSTSREQGETGWSERIKGDVRAVAGEEAGERAGSQSAQYFDECLPEPLERRRSGLSQGRPAARFGAGLSLPAIERVHGGPAGGGNRDDPVCEAPVAGMQRRVEHVREARSQVPREGTAQCLQKKMLGGLLLRLGEGVASPGDGTDCAMVRPFDIDSSGYP